MEILGLLAIVLAFVIINKIVARGKKKSSEPSHKSIVDEGKVEPDTVVCKNLECQQKLRVPKSDKRLTITCPKCSKSFSYPYAPPVVKEEAVKASSHDTVESKPVKPK